MRIMRQKIALALFFLLAFSAIAEDVKPSGKLTKVEPKMVCMINEHAMGSEQIAVTVEGKTYYGCCEMCKKTLASDASKRVAVDPVTGKKVDKATAVIAAQANGRIFYFESDETLAKYNESVK